MDEALTDMNEVALRNAIQASLQDRAALADFGQEAAASESLVMETPKRRNIDDCIDELLSSTVVQLARAAGDGADTAVFISPPLRENEMTLTLYERLRDHYNQPIWINSEKLMACGPEYFRTRLGPKYQIMTKRRREYDLQRLSRSPKYILDLTPPSEGSEAVALTMNMSCSLGIRLWGLSRYRWRVSSALVSGQDDFTPSRPEPASPQPSLPSGFDEVQSPRKARSELPTEEIDNAYEVPPDYSPIRHRCAIERALLALHGFDPTLDSAPKVYSTAVLAEYFGFVGTPLTDYIVRWIRASPNCRIIEVLPEAVLKIGDCLKCGPVARDAFAILVGEAALEISCRNRGLGSHDSSRTVHRRRKEDLEEAWESRVQYASQALVDRVTLHFNNLVEDNMTWMEDLGQWAAISNWPLECSDPLREFAEALKGFVKRCIYHLLCADYMSMARRGIDSSHGGDMLFPLRSFKDPWLALNHHNRIFTRSFWDILKCADFGAMIEYDGSGSMTFNAGRYVMDYRTPSAVRDMENAGMFPNLNVRDLEDRREAAWRDLYPEPKPKDKQAQSQSGDEGSSSHPNPSGSESDSPNKRIRFNLPTLTLRNPFTRTGNGAEAAGPSGPSTEHLLPQPQTTEQTDEVESDVCEGRPGRNNPLAPGGMAPNEPEDDPSSYRKAQLEFSEESDAVLYAEWVKEHGTDDGIKKYLKPPPSAPTLSQFFDINLFFSQVQRELRRQAEIMLALPYGSQSDELELDVTDALVCLGEAETRYLPLWAGGDDDGSSGVFNREIPLADNGFSTPGPGIHNAGSMRGSIEFDMVGVGSTVGTSTVANDGFSNGMDRRRTYPVDEVESMSSDSLLARRMQAETFGIDDKGSVAEETSSAWDEVPTPTGTHNTGTPDLDAANRAMAVMEREEAEEDYGDIFHNTSDDDDDFAYDKVSDDDDEMGGTGDDEMDEMEGYDDTDSYCGFDAEGSDEDPDQDPDSGGADVDHGGATRAPANENMSDSATGIGITKSAVAKGKEPVKIGGQADTNGASARATTADKPGLEEEDLRP